MPDTGTATAAREALRTAVSEAERDQAAYLALQFADLHNDQRPDPGAIVAARQKAEGSEARVEIMRRRLEDAEEADRIAGHHALGARIYELTATATPGAEQVAVLRQLAEFAAAVRARAAAHDEQVRALYAEAGRLYKDPAHDPVKRTGNSARGRRHVAPMGVRYGELGVHVVGGNADAAVAAAVKGDVDEAVKLLTGVKKDRPRPEPTAYYREHCRPVRRDARLRAPGPEPGRHGPRRQGDPDEPGRGDPMATQQTAVRRDQLHPPRWRGWRRTWWRPAGSINTKGKTRTTAMRKGRRTR